MSTLQRPYVPIEHHSVNVPLIATLLVNFALWALVVVLIRLIAR
jgi:hypothetical protein